MAYWIAFLAFFGIVKDPGISQPCEIYLTTANPSSDLENKIRASFARQYDSSTHEMHFLTILQSDDKSTQVVRAHVRPKNNPAAVPMALFVLIEKAHETKPNITEIPASELNSIMIREELAPRLPAGEFIAQGEGTGNQYLVELQYKELDGGAFAFSIWDRMKTAEIIRASLDARHLHAQEDGHVWMARTWQQVQISPSGGKTADFEVSFDLERTEKGWRLAVNKAELATAQLAVQLNLFIPDNQMGLKGARAWESERMVFFGPPGVGKGTLASALHRVYGIEHVGTGDLLRAAAKENTDFGRKVKSYMDQNIFVPDDVVVELVANKIVSQPSRGFILDGFPRTVSQAEKLEALLADMRRPLTQAVFIDAPDSVLLERVMGRKRADDTPEILAQRLKDYREKTAPLETFYRERGLLLAIDGTGTPEQVFLQMIQQPRP